MDLGPHAAFIWSSYAIYALVLLALMAWLVFDGRRLKRRLADLEERGISRRGRSREGAPRTSDASL